MTRHETLLNAALATLCMLALLALAACSPASTDTSDAEEATSSAESTETAATESEGDTICDHPYFPVTDGIVLTYTQVAPGASSEMTQEFDVTGEDSFTVHQVVTGDGTILESDGEWLCTDEGLVKTSNIQLAVNVPGIEFGDLEFTGVTLPPADEFVREAEWQSTYAGSGTADINGTSFEYVFEIIQDNTLTAFESVTVPAGTYDAARVDSTETMKSTANGVATPDVMTTSTTWYAEGVGIVKIETNMDGGLFVQELTSAE